MELHFRNPTTKTESIEGNMYETIGNFPASENAEAELSAGATPKLAAADEGNPNISIDCKNDSD